jgi:transposase
MGEVFGLSISEGALCKILARAQTPLGDAATRITAEVRTARVVCSDETSARVAGRTWWEWVFVTAAGVLHLIRPSRGKIVPQEVFGDLRPGVWVSDALGSQRGHAQSWQMCLAHLLRDTQYAIDCGDALFSKQLKALLLRAIAIGRRRPTLLDITLAQYRADLERRLDRIMATVPISRDGEKLRRRMGRDREHLFVFVTDRDVPPTNNVSERHLRPSVIFRKVTNGFRSEWGAATYAAFRSVTRTAKLQGRTVLSAIRQELCSLTVPIPG